MGDLGHRIRDRLDRGLEVALGSREVVEGSWGRVPWEDLAAAHAHRRWPAAPAEDILVFHRAEEALHQDCEDVDMQYGLGRRPGPERRLV